MDVGVYTLTFASIAFGDDISSIDTSVIMTDTGVDAQSSITISYPDGKMSVLNSSLRAFPTDRESFTGQRAFWLWKTSIFESITVYNENGK